jgi:hypothetical protein
VKSFLKWIVLTVVGGAIGFCLWKLLGRIPLLLWATILSAIPTLVGLEMTFKSPTSPRARGIYRSIFGVWFVASLSIGILQYRDGKPFVPTRPQITFETFSGLPEGLTGNTHLRLHRLFIRNNNPMPIESFCSRLQLGTNELRFSFEGVYRYAAAGKLESQHFLMPIIHDPTTRRLSSSVVQPDDGRWKRVMIEFQ